MTTAQLDRLTIVEALTRHNPYPVRARAYSDWVAGAYSAIAQESPPLDVDPTAKHKGYAWGQLFIQGQTL